MKRIRPPHRTISILLTATLAAAVLIGLAAPGAVAAGQQNEAGLPDTIFGYEAGEQRHYRIGPPDALAPGEIADWWIRFVRLEDHPDAGTAARFEFEHQRFEVMPGTWNPAEDLMEVRVDGRALLSRDGFPLEVDYEQRFLSQGERTAADGRRRVRFVYDFEEQRYEKFLTVGRRDWDFRFGIPGSDEIDREALRGLFVYMPSSVGCIGSSRGTCIEAEPAFANPGFLSIVLPLLLEESVDERHFHFFMPSGIGGSPFMPTNPTGWISRERDNIGNQERYFERWKVKLGASEEIEVGPRTMHAWAMEIGGGVDKIWIEPSGRVLRVDLESTWDNPDRRYIRLVFPYEEFVTPNADPAETCCR